MNIKNLSENNIGHRVRLRPKVLRRRTVEELRAMMPYRVINPDELVHSDGEWIIDRVEKDGITISNVGTGYSRKLGPDNIREFRTDRPGTGPHFLLLRCQLILDGNTVHVEPLRRS